MDDAAGGQVSVSPKISDATLRDTAHMAGVAFDVDDARVLAGLLCDVGIDIVEAGIVSDKDRSEVPLVQAVVEVAGRERTKTVILARSRKQVEEDLDAALETGAGNVMLSIPTSKVHSTLKLGTDSPKRIMTLAARSIEAAVAAGFSVTFTAEDGARTDPGFLEEYVANGAEAGADRFRLAETVSSLAPNDVHALISRLVPAAGRTEVEMHSHNMLGLSVANTLAAVDAGAAWVSCTIDGLGERGGNTPLAEILCVLKVLRASTASTCSRSPTSRARRPAVPVCAVARPPGPRPTSATSTRYPGRYGTPRRLNCLRPRQWATRAACESAPGSSPSCWRHFSHRRPWRESTPRR